VSLRQYWVNNADAQIGSKRTPSSKSTLPSVSSSVSLQLTDDCCGFSCGGHCVTLSGPGHPFETIDGKQLVLARNRMTIYSAPFSSQPVTTLIGNRTSIKTR
jgi:hypothetical protein